MAARAVQCSTRTWKTKTFVALVFTLANLTVVSGAVSWNCNGVLPIYEDHEPGENSPIITITTTNSEVVIVENNPKYPDLTETKQVGDTFKVYLTRSIKKVTFPGGFVLKSSHNGPCHVTVLPVNLHEPRFIDGIFREKIPENLKEYEFFVSMVDDEDLRRGTDMNSLSFSIRGADASVALFELVTNQDKVNFTYTVKMKLKKELDFEKQRTHRLDVIVKDQSEDRPNAIKEHEAYHTFDVEVQDVHDQSPKFSSECGVRNVEEHTKKKTLVTTIQAMDGDTQMNNIFKYSFSTKVESGDRPDVAKVYFEVNENTGEIKIKEEPDRESEHFLANPSIFFSLQAVEYRDSTTIENEPNTVVTRCYFQITDIDDWPPKFDKETYEVTVDEHSPNNYPLPFEPAPYVFDNDMGDNATYKLSLQGKGSELFSVIPTDGQNHVSFSIRVMDSKALDYESTSIPDHKITFVLWAVGKKNQKFTDTAYVTVIIEDVNDNAPEFTPDHYDVALNETVTIGQFVLKVKATDKDSGTFGEEGIRYSILTKQKDFEINNITGEITVKEGHGIDREIQEDLYLTVQATDELGEGQSASAQVHIQVEDDNDQKPEFLIKNYKTILYENADQTEGDIQVQALDKDKPETPNSIVNYELLTYTKFFSLNVSSGVLSLIKPLDFEEDDPEFPDILNKEDRVWKRVFIVSIQAYDLGVPRQVSEDNATVIIDFVDMNDNVPIFETTSLHTTILETIRKGTELNLTLKATDADLSKDYNKVYYRFFGEPHSSFLVNRTTGKLTISPSPLLAPEDNEYRENHTFPVEATDGFLEQDPDQMCEVTVTVVDVNNRKPFFEDTVVNDTEVVEEQEIYFPMATFKATDVDTTRHLVYTLDYLNSAAEAPNRTAISSNNYNFAECFFIDSENGSLTVFNVDREEVKFVDLLIVVNDTMAEENHPQTATTRFKITVLDINDNYPIFLNNDTVYGYNANIVENRPEPRFLKIEATDIDEHNNITYSLDLDSSIYNVSASINSQTGVIDFGPVDYEEHSEVNFTVTITDSDPAPKSSNATVTVFVEDLNDNKPEFSSTGTYEISIPENTPEGEIVVTLHATDKDSGLFGLVHYRISSKNDDKHSKYFEILNAEVGNVTIAISPDFEKINPKELAVLMEAYDNPLAISNLQNSDSRQLRVIVTDMNDNAPEFVIPSECLSAKEDIAVNLDIGKVLATDADEPNSNNSFVEYHILNVDIPEHLIPDDKAYFRLDIITGTLYANRNLSAIPLKGTDPTFNLTLMAIDRGDIPLNSTGEFCVFIKDINNFRPVFTVPDPEEGDKTFSFYESKEGQPTFGKYVTKVEADDKDWDSDNHRVTYSYADGTDSDAKKHFKLDSNTGTITINYELRQKEISEYKIIVEACDNPKDSSTRLCTSEEESVKIIVLVKSDVDSLPKFQNRSNQELHFTEHAEPGSEVQIAPEANFDAVVEKPPSICYFIIGGDKELFSLDMNNRNLVVNQDLDREIHSHHWIAIKATISCQEPPELDVVHALQGMDAVNVTIRLIDINDNPPRFESRNFTAGISSSTNTRDQILKTKLQAVDPDEGENAIFEYEIVGEVEIMGEYMDALISQVKETHQQPFTVHNTTGEITVKFAADKKMKGHFKFNVKAEDRAGNKDEIVALIYLMREDQQIVVLVQKPLAQMTTEFLNAFSGEVRSVLRYAFNVDNYMAYTGPKTELHTTSSTIWAHLVNTTTNEVLGAKDALKVINQHYAELVQKTQSVGGPLLEAYEKVEEQTVPEKDYVMIILIAALGCLLLALSLTCGIFIYKLKTSHRKLRAEKAGNKKDDETEKTFSSAPNTNAYTSKGSNPIWTESETVHGNIAMENATTFDSGFDTDSVSSIGGLDLPDFEPTNNPLFEENKNMGDGFLNEEFDEKQGREKNSDGNSLQKEKPTFSKLDTISNLKKAEEKWRQKKNENTTPGSNNNKPFQMNTTRKKMDYFPEYQEESDL